MRGRELERERALESLRVRELVKVTKRAFKSVDTAAYLESKKLLNS